MVSGFQSLDFRAAKSGVPPHPFPPTAYISQNMVGASFKGKYLLGGVWRGLGIPEDIVLLLIGALNPCFHD